MSITKHLNLALGIGERSLNHRAVGAREGHHLVAGTDERPTDAEFALPRDTRRLTPDYREGSGTVYAE